jgi:hypothetical protein
MAVVTVEKRLRCVSVTDGMFSSERIIAVRDGDGDRVEFIVQAEDVQSGCVAVWAFKRGRTRTWLAVVPSYPYPETITVDEDDLLDPPWESAAADRRDRGLADVFG